MWLSIDGKKINTNDDSIKGTLDIFELDYSLDLTLIWRSKNDYNIEKTHEELAKIILQSAFKSLLHINKNN